VRDRGSRPGLHLVAEGSLGPNAPTLFGGVLTPIAADAATLCLCFPCVSALTRCSPDVAAELSNGSATCPAMTGCY